MMKGSYILFDKMNNKLAHFAIICVYGLLYTLSTCTHVLLSAESTSQLMRGITSPFALSINTKPHLLQSQYKILTF